MSDPGTDAKPCGEQLDPAVGATAAVAEWPRCEGCTHWLFDEPDWQFERLRFGKCAAIKQREDIIEPARKFEEWADQEKEEMRLLGLAKAIAVDGSGYYAALRTAADFGCTLHTPRQP